MVHAANSTAAPTLLDNTFKVSLVLKGLDGRLELVGGFLLVFIAYQCYHMVVAPPGPWRH